MLIFLYIVVGFAVSAWAFHDVEKFIRDPRPAVFLAALHIVVAVWPIVLLAKVIRIGRQRLVLA